MWARYEPKTETGGDIAYILLADEHPGEAAIKIVTVRPEQTESEPSVADAVEGLMLEFDNENRLVAIEVWGASTSLPKSFLDLASRETRPKPIRSKK